MFEVRDSDPRGPAGDTGGPSGEGPVRAAEVVGWLSRLAEPLPTGVGESSQERQAGLVDLLARLEQLKAAAAGVQAELSVLLYRLRGQPDGAVANAGGAGGDPLGGVFPAVAAEVALARRESGSRGAERLGLALTLSEDLPGTLAGLRAGDISEAVAVAVAREVAVLTPQGRQVVDTELAAALPALSDRQAARRARACAQRLAPQSATDRACAARATRRVTLRPVADSMALLTGVLPAEQGVAVWQALHVAAAAAAAEGDSRTTGQLMADTLVAQVTGQTTAATVPLEVHLVISDTALFGEGDTPARLPGYGPIPAGYARELIAGTRCVCTHPDRRPDPGAGPRPGTDPRPSSDSPDGPRPGRDLGLGPGAGPGRDSRKDGGGPDGGGGRDEGVGVCRRCGEALEQARVWLRRVYTQPGTGELVAMDSRRRVFDGLLRRMVVLRDQTCRVPYCTAPVRHIDHLRRAADGGRTAYANAAGLCARHNLVKEAAGWVTTLDDDAGSDTGTEGGHQVLLRTPTGHTYRTSAPPILDALHGPGDGGSPDDGDDPYGSDALDSPDGDEPPAPPRRE